MWVKTDGKKTSKTHSPCDIIHQVLLLSACARASTILVLVCALAGTMAASCSGARAGGASLGWEVPFDQDDEMMTTNIQRAQAQTCRLQVPNQCILATLLTLLSLCNCRPRR